MKYAEKHSIKKAAARFHEPDKTIYRWRKKWLDSNKDMRVLVDKSRKPHNHANAHTTAELKLIKDMRRRNPNLGLQDLWIKLRKRGYTRSQPALLKVLKRLGTPTNPKALPSPTCKKTKPYESMNKPGERIQIDVKYVPKDCLSLEFREQYPLSRLYQYTAIDEYSRVRVLEDYLEHNTYSSSLFLGKVVGFWKKRGILVECIQTDNGSEFTKVFQALNDHNLSQFELMAKRLHIRIKHIKPHTPKHNGKVERSHREDQKLFYSEIIRTGKLITDIEDFRKRLAKHQDRTNNRPMRPLNYLSPNEYLEQYKQKHTIK